MLLLYFFLTYRFELRHLCVKISGLKIGAIGIDECAKEKHKIGKCTNLVKASPEYSVASGDYGKVPAPSSSLTIVSMDVLLKADYTHIFPPNRRCQPDNPCLNGGTCFTTVPECPGFVCKCPEGYHGPRCEMTTRTFYGNSYIWLPKLTAYEMSEIEFDFITLTADGLLLYQGPLEKGSNNGAKDFIAVPLVDGRVQVHLSLGHAPVVVKMNKGPRLDDGEWHTVHVSRRHKVRNIKSMFTIFLKMQSIMGYLEETWCLFGLNYVPKCNAHHEERARAT